MDEFQTTPIMENVSPINRDLYFEAVKARGRKRGALLLAGAGIIMMPGGLLMGSEVLAGLSFLITLLALFSHIIIGKRDFAKLMRLHPSGQWIKTVSFYSDRIETDSGYATPSVGRYENIKREIETEHMYVLDYGTRAPATMMRKDGFQNGSLALLKEFLAEMRENTLEVQKERSVKGDLCGNSANNRIKVFKGGDKQ